MQDQFRQFERYFPIFIWFLLMYFYPHMKFRALEIEKQNENSFSRPGIHLGTTRRITCFLLIYFVDEFPNLFIRWFNELSNQLVG